MNEVSECVTVVCSNETDGHCEHTQVTQSTLTTMQLSLSAKHCVRPASAAGTEPESLMTS